MHKCIRTAKDVKASAKDLQNFADWLFAHSFITNEVHSALVKHCQMTGKPQQSQTAAAMRKKSSELSLSNGIPAQMATIPSVMANGMGHLPHNPAHRAEQAGKTLIEYCEFARQHYEGLGQDQGVTALNGYFSIDRVRQSFVVLRGIPIGR